jgi:glutamate/tyrosine decarboxylase-like PLP-dependent enzyme
LRSNNGLFGLQVVNPFSDEMPGMRHWGIQLSRRALCLKVWFVMRLYGLENMQKHVRHLIYLAYRFRELIKKDGRFDLLGGALGLVTFRLKVGDYLCYYYSCV